MQTIESHAPRRPTPADRFDRVCAIMTAHGNDPSRLIPILQAVQEDYRYLPQDVLAYVATGLGLPAAHVYGVATFYAHFALEPKGKYVLKMCDGTACHVRSSMVIVDALRAKLGVTAESPTTADQLFTVETVACLGACGLAPVLVVNEDVHGQVTPERALALVEDLRAQEAKLTEGDSP